MSSAALLDLQTRVLSNTLTGPQQAALAEALGDIYPTFPTPDEQSNGIAPPEETLARIWIAALYAINGEGSQVLPTTVTDWYVNFITGADSNSGTSPGAPLQTIAALGALWRGTAGGGRPVLDPATGTTVTVHLQSAFPTTDPLAPILDVDITKGNALIIESVPVNGHSGTIASANAWARTLANGQVRITDASVADFSIFIGDAQLVEDSNTGAVCWLYGPDSGSSATGTCSVGYSAQAAGSFPAITETALNAGNSYTLSAPLAVSLGQGFVTRSFPEEGDAAAQVFFYRLGLTNGGLNPQATLQSPTVGYTFQECRIEATLVPILGACILANCLEWRTLGTRVQGPAVAQLLAGALQGENSGTLFVSQGGQIIVDQDFALTSATPYQCVDGGTLIIGDAGYWTQGGGTAAILNAGGLFLHQPFFDSEGVIYGADGGTVVSQPDTNGAGVTVLDSVATAVNQFACTNSNFTVGGQTSAFGFNEGTGAYVGPTTCTFAHVDAALAAGTGFGAHAVDPRSGSTFGKG